MYALYISNAATAQLSYTAENALHSASTVHATTVQERKVFTDVAARPTARVPAGHTPPQYRNAKCTQTRQQNLLRQQLAWAAPLGMQNLLRQQLGWAAPLGMHCI